MPIKSYEMFTVQGDREVAMMIAHLGAVAEAGTLSRRALPGILRERVRGIAKRHPEVHDTAVREAIADAIDAICTERGWTPLTDREA